MRTRFLAHHRTHDHVERTRPVGASDFTAYSTAVIHRVYVEVMSDELTLHAIDATGKEFDSVVIPRQ